MLTSWLIEFRSLNLRLFIVLRFRDACPQLAVFLLANVLTGLVNMTTDTVIAIGDTLVHVHALYRETLE